MDEQKNYDSTPWYIQGPLSEEETGTVGGMEMSIVTECKINGEPSVESIMDSEFVEGNLERAVQCVNACAGMEDPAERIAELSKMAVHGASFEMARLRNIEAAAKRLIPCLFVMDEIRQLKAVLEEKNDV